MADGNKFIAPTMKEIKCNAMLLSGTRIEPIEPIITEGAKFGRVEEDSYNAEMLFWGDVPNVVFGTEKSDIIIEKADGTTLIISVSNGYFTTFKNGLNAFYFNTDTEFDQYTHSFEVYLKGECAFDFTQLLRAGDSASCYGLNFGHSFTVKEIDAHSIEITKEFDKDRIITDCRIYVHNVWSKESLKDLRKGNIIRFKGSNYNTTDFAVKSVDGNTIYFEDEIGGETTKAVDEDIPNTKQIHILRADNTESFPNFKVGDAVTILGCTNREDNNRTFVINKILGNTLYSSGNIFLEGSESSITISRRIPKLDYICEAENRLWGCSNDENTIYISALGDPTNMYTYEGLSTDSFATAVGSPGEFTGCCRYSSSVLFFKEDKIHKILGSYPGDYTLYSYDVEGIQKGSDKSAVVINEVLYYKGVHGIYAYDGGVPTLISECFGEKTFYEAVAGTDGISYYVSMRDGDNIWYLFSYNTATGIWTLEDKGFHAKDALRIGMELYFRDNYGVLWKENALSDVSQSEWMMQFTPFYETIQGKKTYSRILLRAEIPQGSYIKIEMRCDGKRWMEMGKIVGKSEGVVPIRIPVNRCDKFEIRLSGKGEFVLREMLREFYISKE